MFFAIGINDKEEQLEYEEGLMNCEACGSYGRYNVFMICTVFYFFFIPLFRWNYRYFVETSCCHTVYQLNDEVGMAIENGERIIIRPKDLTLIRKGNGSKVCSRCGYTTNEDFEYCPKCGKRFE